MLYSLLDMKKNLYQITVYSNDNLSSGDFTGNFWATSPEAAMQEAKEFYAHELDTVPEKVRIYNIKAI